MLRTVLLAILFACSARGEVIPLDPVIAFGDLADHYRRSPRAERVEVRVLTDGQSRAEPVLLQIVPPGTLQLTLGDLTAWSDSDVLRITHRQDEQAYFETPVEGRDLIRTLEAVLPPLPLPQIALAFADDPAAELTPYTGGVRWTAASLTEQGAGGVYVIEGSGDRVDAVLRADASTGRVLKMVTTLDGGRASIELTTERLTDSESPRIGIDLERRSPVKDLGGFVARGARIMVGDVLPALGLSVWLDGSTLSNAEPEGPSAIILMRRWRPGASPRAAFRAADTVVRDYPGFKVYIAIVFEPSEPNENALADGAEQEAAPRLVHRTNDPGATIERFAASSDQVLVVLDAGRVVRAIEPLEPGVGGAPIDAAEVDRLTSVMMQAFGG